MKKWFLVAELERLRPMGDEDMEMAHLEADNLLLEYVNDDDIRRAYDEIPKSY